MSAVSSANSSNPAVWEGIRQLLQTTSQGQRQLTQHAVQLAKLSAEQKIDSSTSTDALLDTVV